MIVLYSILDSIAKGISLFPRFFAWCIPTSILNDFYTCTCRLRVLLIAMHNIGVCLNSSG